MARPTLSRAVAGALRAVSTTPADAGAVALARRLAHDIDTAQLVYAELVDALDALRAEGSEQHDTLRRLAVRIEATTVLTQLAPKLLAVLAELGMTPKARAAVLGKAVGGDGAGQSALDAARERRARQRHAAAVDPTPS